MNSTWPEASEAENALSVLLVDDNPADAEQILDQLRRAGWKPALNRVETQAEFVRELKMEPDIVLAEFELPDFSVIDGLRGLREAGLEESTPLLVVSRTIGEEGVAEAMRSGASDFVSKDQLTRLGPAVLRAIRELHLRHEVKDAHSRLRASDELFRGLAENMPQPFWITDLQLRRLVYINPALESAQAALGIEVDEPSRMLEKIIHPEDRASIVAAIQQAAAGLTTTLEYRVVVERETRWFHCTIFPIRDADGNIHQAAGVLEDTTDRKRTDGQLRDRLVQLRMIDEERRNLLARLVSAQEEERRRIASDVHDDSIQVMAAAALRISMLRQQMGDHEFASKLAVLEETVTDAIGRLRRLVFQLRPPELERAGLVPALREFVTQWIAESGLAYEIEDRLNSQPDFDSRTILFRIAQEALTNVHKHARADQVIIEVSDKDQGTLMRIVDDGVGFSTQNRIESAVGHFGLISMRERAQLAGGWWKVMSTPGEGSTVECWIPNEGEYGRAVV